MSSVPFGVDLGNNNTVIAVAKNRGIDIVVNEVSNRATPTVVGFGRKNRFIGETGKNQQTSNLKNTAENIKRILGLEYDHPDFQHESKFFSTELVKNKEGGISTKVRFLGEPTEFSSTQLVGMYLNKIKDTAAKDVKGTIHDICLAVPIWYTEQMRRAAHDACILAGLNPVRIVNDLTAAAVGYGVFKTDISEEPKKVAFVDMGHSSYSVAIAEVKKGELKVLGSASDKHFGGRDFDRAITEHFADVFKDKYKFNIRENAKAYQRVLVAAEKLKKVLSANSQAPFNVESVMNDVDASGQLTRQELEEMVQPLLEKLSDPVEQALKLANLTTEDIDFVEVIGGCTRVPAIKERISQVFNKKLSFTLNQDEAIAKGAAFICAMHSPTMRVRPFKFEDVNPYSVSYFWEKDAEDVDHMEVFPRGGLFPSTKLITLYRSKDFEIEAKYTKLEELPKGTNPFIAKWTIKGVVPNEGDESIACKIKLRNDPSGFYTIESAHTVEEKEVQELVENPEAAEDAEPEYKTVKKLVKKNDLVLEAATLSYPADVLNTLIEQENRMLMDDKLVADTEDRKNALEEYIYTLRGKLDEEYKDFASDEEKSKLGEMLLKAEDWLYDEGFDSTKAKYIAKYEELASIGNIIRGRYLAKEEEKKQSILAKQEAKKAAEIAEKMAAERSARQNPEQPKEEPKKDDDEMDLD